jgi:NTE family protein
MDQPVNRPSLLSASFLKDATPEALAAAEDAVEWISIPGGWPLFEAGDPADAIYFVLSGSLGAFRRDAAGKTELLGYIRPGEPVGEMAMVAGEAHSNSVYTLRDSELFRIERSAFNRLIRAHPSLMNNLARIMLVRARQTKRPNRLKPFKIACAAWAAPAQSCRRTITIWRRISATRWKRNSIW